MDHFGVGRNAPHAWSNHGREVADCDAAAAKAAEQGGAVTMPAQDVPEAGRMAWVAALSSTACTST